MTFEKCAACSRDLGTSCSGLRPHYPPWAWPLWAPVLVSAILMSALRSRERRFESYWGRFFWVAIGCESLLVAFPRKRLVKPFTTRLRGNAGASLFHYALPGGPVTVIVTSSEPEWTVSSKPPLLPMLDPPPPCGTVAPPWFR